MSDMTPFIASGSTDGRMIKVVATATAGTLLHTAVAGADDKDEVWIWAVNSDPADVKLTIEAGGVTSPDDLIEKTITSEDGHVLIMPGFRYNGGVVIRAFAATANVIMCHVNVNRIRRDPV